MDQNFLHSKNFQSGGASGCFSPGVNANKPTLGTGSAGLGGRKRVACVGQNELHRNFDFALGAEKLE